MIIDFFRHEERISRDDFVHIFSRKGEPDYTQLVGAHGVRNYLYSIYLNTSDGKNKSPKLRKMFKKPNK